MSRRLVWLIVCCLMLGMFPLAAAASPPAGRGSPGELPPNDNITPNPLAEKQTELRQTALEQTVQGTAKKNGKVVEVAKGQYVELGLEKTDHIFTILVEFGGGAGPLHNKIAEPNRGADNSTYWLADFNHEHYEDMLFSTAPGANSMANYYTEQSSGRYTVDGTVTDWVRVASGEAAYGNNDCGNSVCSDVWRLVDDALAQWTTDQEAAGMSAGDIRAYLQQFDVWDRYDQDGDGNFDEPDGYIDHFQIIHAGEGEEAGGGAQGTDAIWSHRWYTHFPDIGTTGPSDYSPFGGSVFPGTDIWVGDYTIEPENGGVGVFAHEFAHDLGLPDEYDTSYLGEASSAFWTLMSSGSWMGDGQDSIGTRPDHMNAWDKLMLGWMNYDRAYTGKRSSHRIGPAETNTKAAQALIVILPKREHTVSVNTPFAGSYEWWSGMGDNLNNTLTRTVDLTGKSSAELTAKAWYQIEAGYDYLYAEVSADGGGSWTAIPGMVGGSSIGDDGGGHPAIDGTSVGWVNLSYDLSAYAGQSVLFRWRYATDGGVALKGFAADEIAITDNGSLIFTDGAEAGDNGWTANGFSRFQGSSSGMYNNYYIAEFRQYRGFDQTLRSGPYSFSGPLWVEHFPYQDGLLISYWDTFYNDNNVGAHPGEGLILPIDAHPQPLLRSNGSPWRTRIQVYDATFGLEKTDAIRLTSDGTTVTYPSLPAAKAFNDLNDYWFASKPDAGVKVPKTGTTVEVINYNAQGSFMQVNVRPSK